MTPLNPSKRVETAKNSCRTMGTLCSKRVDKLETMFFWAFQAYSTALYDFKWVFCKKKILVVPHIFQNFKPTIRGPYWPYSIKWGTVRIVLTQGIQKFQRKNPEPVLYGFITVFPDFHCIKILSFPNNQT